jgi:CO/xanthine dehydrogenase FAD-binding subunit
MIMVINTHPTLPEFDYLRPHTLREASDFLQQHHGEAYPFLGGTDLLVRMRDGALAPKFLLDVKGLPGTNDLDFDPSSGLVIGAAVNMNRVIASPAVQEHYPLLVEACRSVASYQLRNRATIVGNICNASPAGDTIGASLAYGGILRVHGAGGLRHEPLAGFFLAPGKTRLQPGDVAIALHLPPPPAGSKGSYVKLGRNQLSDLSIVGVSALGYADVAMPSGYRFHLILASVAPVPFVAEEAEACLASTPITAASIREAAHLAAKACTPIDDVRSSARYRKQMVSKLSIKALSEVWEKISQ